MAWTAQCQSLDYRSLHEQCGVDGYDVRIWYHPDHSIEFRHGVFSYEALELHKFLSYCSEHHLAIRIMLESRSKRMQKEAEFYGYEKRFIADCALWQRVYSGIRFFGGRNIYTWKVLLDFNTPAPVEYEYHASMDGKQWYKQINNIWPWLWTWVRSRSSRPRFIPTVSGTKDKTYPAGAPSALLLDFCQMWNS